MYSIYSFDLSIHSSLFVLQFEYFSLLFNLFFLVSSLLTNWEYSGREMIEPCTSSLEVNQVNEGWLFLITLFI